MSKIAALFAGLAAVLLFSAAVPQSAFFSKYKSIEAYEVRPGILAVPRYTADGEVCEIGLERLHYSPDLIRIESSFSDQEIDQLIDQFAPPEARGAEKPLLGNSNEMETFSGASYASTREYEKVEVQTYGGIINSTKSSIQSTGDIAIVIKWKDRKCR